MLLWVSWQGRASAVTWASGQVALLVVLSFACSVIRAGYAYKRRQQLCFGCWVLACESLARFSNVVKAWGGFGVGCPAVCRHMQLCLQHVLGASLCHQVLQLCRLLPVIDCAGASLQFCVRRVYT